MIRVSTSLGEGVCVQAEGRDREGMVKGIRHTG